MLLEVGRLRNAGVILSNQRGQPESAPTNEVAWATSICWNSVEKKVTATAITRIRLRVLREQLELQRAV
jgi:hypothetical protein